jgi:hypothetical protein
MSVRVVYETSSGVMSSTMQSVLKRQGEYGRAFRIRDVLACHLQALHLIYPATQLLLA